MDTFDQGRMAYLVGAHEEDNPHMRSTCTLYSARSWHRGWLYERDELREVRAEMHHDAPIGRK